MLSCLFFGFLECGKLRIVFNVLHQFSFNLIYKLTFSQVCLYQCPAECEKRRREQGHKLYVEKLKRDCFNVCLRELSEIIFSVFQSVCRVNCFMLLLFLLPCFIKTPITHFSKFLPVG